MSSESFTISKKALITLIAASIVVIISLGIRQTFGLFYFDFNTDLDISISHFGFVMGLQLLLWGVFSPLFGVITDKYGGAVAIVLLEAGKCLATTDTGIPIAVEPNPIPIITPIVKVK